MQYSVVIPSHRSFACILPLLQSLQEQTILPKEVLIIYDKIITTSDYHAIQTILERTIQKSLLDSIHVYTHLTDDIQTGKGVSYLRNVGITHSTGDYILSIDDDNTFAKDFIQKLYEVETAYYAEYHKRCLVVPTEYYKNKIRSRGYVKFNYMLGIPVPYREQHGICVGEEYVGYIQFCSSNCLFAHRDIFVKHPFPDDIPFVYEDFIMTASVYRSGIPLLVVHGVGAHHHMKQKSALENSYISTTEYAYQKGRNRILFVYTLASKQQWILYICSGLFIHTVALVIKIMLYSNSFIQRFKLLQYLFLGTRDGLFNKLLKKIAG